LWRRRVHASCRISFISARGHAPGTIASDQQTMSETESKADKIARLPSALCWVALSLFAASLALPALRVQGKGEWIAGDLGCNCAFLSLAEFPCWVPHALVIGAPFIAMFASKQAQKVSGLVLGIITLTVLRVCIPQVALTNFRQGPLTGFWLWAAALITATAGLSLGGFSPVRTSEPGQCSAGVSPRGWRSCTRPKGALVFCGLAFSIFVVTNLVNLRFYIDGSFPGRLSRGISFFIFDRVVIPALLAMAPFACLYAGARTQQFTALTLGFLGAFPALSIDRPAEQPFEALAPLLVSYLTVAIAAAGLLISAGLMNRNRKPPAGLAEPAGAELPDRQSGTPEVSRAVTRGNPPLGSALCWLALAHSFGLGSLALHFEWIDQLPIALHLLMSPHTTWTCSLLAMAPWVCAFSGPRARRVLGALLALGAPIMFRGIWWFGKGELPDVIASCLSAAGLFWADVAARQGFQTPGDSPRPHGDHGTGISLTG
jgi:hypothetical protein